MTEAAAVTPLEVTIKSLLDELVDSRVYPDAPPDDPVFPCITYQQVGGRPYTYVDGSLPDKDHARLQFMVHGPVRSEVMKVARAIPRKLVAPPLSAEIYGGLTSSKDDTAKLYITRQDFGCWFAQ